MGEGTVVTTQAAGGGLLVELRDFVFGIVALGAGIAQLAHRGQEIFLEHLLGACVAKAHIFEQRPSDQANMLHLSYLCGVSAYCSRS